LVSPPAVAMTLVGASQDVSVCAVSGAAVHTASARPGIKIENFMEFAQAHRKRETIRFAMTNDDFVGDSSGVAAVAGPAAYKWNS
jgi:hypothetical protein